MRTRVVTRVVRLVTLFAALWLVRPMSAQVSGTLPAIASHGLRVEIQDVARLPDTRNLRPATDDAFPAAWALVSFVRDLPDGRRFANDARGRLYVLDEKNQPRLYFDLSAAISRGIYRGRQSGLLSFVFHPEFARNGLLYTVHGEKAQDNPVVPHFIPPGFTTRDVTFHTVVTEWHTTDAAANIFNGGRRELLRVGHAIDSYRHPIGTLEFNPAATPGSPDYGLLYMSGGDWGFSNPGGGMAIDPAQMQRLDTVLGAILRIDPRRPDVSRGLKGIGDYTIPAVNKFAADGDPKTFGEIYAYGFRNAHRLSWDVVDGTMFATDIGASHVEEINIVHEGGNYGWMRREGIFDNGINVPKGTSAQVYPLAAHILDGSTNDGYTYPVAMYGHRDGLAITGGFAYHGRIPALRGKFVFGDIMRGRVFAADAAALKAADEGIPTTVAPIEEVQLFVREENGSARNVSFKELVEQAMGGRLERADLHISVARDGELLLTSRQDGTIRTLASPRDDQTSAAPR